MGDRIPIYGQGRAHRRRYLRHEFVGSARIRHTRGAGQCPLFTGHKFGGRDIFPLNKPMLKGTFIYLRNCAAAFSAAHSICGGCHTENAIYSGGENRGLFDAPAL